MKKRIWISLFLLIVFSTYQISNEPTLNFKLNIEKIIVENNSVLNELEIKKDLNFLYNSNLFLLKNEIIKDKLKKNSFIEGLEIKKVYPNTIKIKVFEKEPVFILQDKKKKYYYTKNNKVISYTNIEKFKNLPYVFGDEKNFKELFINLKKLKFPIDIIKSFQLYESKRWDLITYDNKTIKLPIKDYEESLKNFIYFKKKDNFKNFKIFDYRINDQLILK